MSIGITLLGASCTPGIHDLDLENKQVNVTHNVDSTRSLDSTGKALLQRTQTSYSFGEDGTGTKHA